MVHGNHFFMCMSQENYAEKLIVPKAFRIKRLNGVGDCDQEHAKLQTKTGEAWHVKVVRSDDEEMWLEKGWEKFVKDNEVRLGDFLMFQHKENMVFDVLLFDPSACEKEYCSTSKKKKSTAAKIKDSKIAALKPLKAAKTYKTSRPHFVKRIAAHNLSKNPLEVPINFARSNGLARKGRKATLIRDLWKKNLQNVNLAVSHEPQERVRFSTGIFQFFKANDIREGDVCVFELDPVAEKKGKIVFYVKVFRRQSSNK